MSIRIQTLVWERSKLKGTELNALLALADQANDENGETWPSLDTLQAKLRFDSRQGLLACLKRVERSGEMTKIVRHNQTGASINSLYRIEVAVLLSQPQLYHYSFSERQAAKAAAKGGSAPVDTLAGGEGQPQLTGGVSPSSQGGSTPADPKHNFNHHLNPKAAAAEEQGLEEQWGLELAEAEAGQAAAALPFEDFSSLVTYPAFQETALGTDAFEGFELKAPEVVESKPASSEDFPGGLTARSALRKCFKTQAFLDQLLTEFDDRQLWLELPPSFVSAALKAARQAYGPGYTTPLIQALDAEVQARKSKKTKAPKAPKATPNDRLARLASLKGE